MAPPDTSDETSVLIHRNKWKVTDIKEDVAWCLMQNWNHEEWKPSAALVHKKGGTTTSGSYRTDKINPQFGGNYWMDMYGLLYPNHLEVRFVGSRDSCVQLIPLRQIVWLEFGDGGVPIKNQ
ncbi:hypothetical protein N8766_02660 [bacterium]|jgi:hypothetical protein|nr:hypothetical protein [Verrucomicrobiota bacterium]MDA7632987.1 hypothetical protein [bacterium]